MNESAALKKVIDTVRGKKPERKPQKAMDAGARGRRLLQRREYKAKISPLEYGVKTKFPSTAILGSPIIEVVF